MLSMLCSAAHGHPGKDAYERKPFPSPTIPARCSRQFARAAPQSAALCSSFSVVNRVCLFAPLAFLLSRRAGCSVACGGTFLKLPAQFMPAAQRAGWQAQA